MHQRHYDSLEGLRFISSVMIVLTHYVTYTLADPTALNWTSDFHYAVDLFFVISGIVIAHVYAGRIRSIGDYLAFLKNRVARVYPLHLATLLFYAAIGLLVIAGALQVANADKYDFGNFIPNLLMVHAWGFADDISFNYVSWSISAEFFVYLLFPAILWTMTRRNAVALSVLIAVFAAVWIAAPMIAGRDLSLLTFDYSILRALPAFSLGVWLVVKCPAFSLGGWERALLHAVLAATAVALLTHQPPLLCLLLVYSVPALAFLCDRAGLSTFTSWAPLKRRGDLTYSIYMLHTVVATVVFTVLAPRLVGGVTWPVVLTAMAMTYILSVASLRYFEQPARDAIKSWRVPFGASRGGRKADAST